MKNGRSEGANNLLMRVKRVSGSGRSGIMPSTTASALSATRGGRTGHCSPLSPGAEEGASSVQDRPRTPKQCGAASQVPQEFHRGPEYEPSGVPHDDRAAFERFRRSARTTADIVVGRLDRHVQTVYALVDVEHPAGGEPDHDRAHRDGSVTNLEVSGFRLQSAEKG